SALYPLSLHDALPISLPARRAALVPPAAGRRRRVREADRRRGGRRGFAPTSERRARGRERVRRRAETEVRRVVPVLAVVPRLVRSEEHTSELQSRFDL